ncbi:hypothetical protein ACFE04_013564 [Oxalis oulophora]
MYLQIPYVFVFILFVSTLFRVLQRKNTKLPPGPFPIPIIGDLFKIGHNPHKSLSKLANTYGPIFSLELGVSKTIVVSSAEIAKQVLQKKDVYFSARSTKDALQAHQHNQVSIVWLPVSNRWRNLRKICNSEIFTSQKLDSLQDLRHKKVEELVAYAQECCRTGVAVDIGQAGFSTSLNLISNTVFSVDLSNPCSEVSEKFKELVWSMMEEAGKSNIADFFPVLRRFDPQGIRRRMTVLMGKMIDFLDSMIDQRLESRKSLDSRPGNDVLDTLLNISEDKTYPIERIDIQHLLFDLFAAGTDTTSITMEWAMAELLHNPTTLTKVRQELEQNIGRGNLVKESDISRLPYLQAIVKETLRLHPAAPMLVPRKPDCDVEICGYTIPKGTRVIINAWAIGRDPTTWENPDRFFPERFMGSNIDVRGHNFELIPFGAGRRICPGLPLALRMLHLTLASLLHSFDWKLVDGMMPKDMNMEDNYSFNLRMAVPLRAIPVHV